LAHHASAYSGGNFAIGGLSHIVFPTYSWHSRQIA
jgi:hypothetical protein